MRPWASIVLGYAAGLAGVTLVSLFIGLVLGQVNEVPSDRPPLWLDPVEIGEVLSNLVENATKYAPPATDLRLEVRRDGGVVSVVVSDRGPGTPSAALPRLSDPVYRVIDGRPRPHGLGLGLAVVKGLVEAHGGRVWAENGAGGGARFTLTMPASAAAEAEAPAPVAADSLA